MNSLQTVLVTGGCGAIGSVVVNTLKRKYPNTTFVNLDALTYAANPNNIEKNVGKYVFIKGNICNVDIVTHVLTTYKPSVIFHLAAETHVDNSFGNSFNFTQSNIFGTHVMLECSRRYVEEGGKLLLFVHMSTDEVYGSVDDTSEHACNEKSLLLPSNPYAAAKAGAEMICQAYIKSFKMPIVIVRCNNAISKYQHPEKLIPRTIDKFLANERITVHGQGLSKRTFVDSYDITRALDMIVSSETQNSTKQPSGTIYNIGSHEEYTVMDVIKIVADLVYSNQKWVMEDIVTYIPDRNFQDYRYWIDSKVLKDIGWKPIIPFRESIKDVLKMRQLKNRDEKCIEKCIEKESCRVCGGLDLICVLDLGHQVLANQVHDNTKQLPTYPLQLMVCKNEHCFHAQLHHVISPDVLFSHYNYVTGTSETMKNYFRWLAEKITEECKKEGGRKKILDIGCNDGTFLNSFKDLGWDTYGVDPAKNITDKVTDHKIFSGMFGVEVAKQIIDLTSSSSYLDPNNLNSNNYCFDAITAANVFAHLDDLYDFLQGCRMLMSKDTVLYIQTSQCNMFQNAEFDTIYHEHVSYFSIRSMSLVISSNGLHITNFQKTNIHGCSFLFTIKRDSEIDTPIPKSLKDAFDQERAEGIYDIKQYEQYSTRVHKKIDRLLSIIPTDKKIIGYGAAAKGNVFLGYVSKLKLEYIIDDCVGKQGLYTPGRNIHIKDPNEALQKENCSDIAILPLAWNFYDEINWRSTKILPGVMVIDPREGAQKTSCEFTATV